MMNDRMDIVTSGRVSEGTATRQAFASLIDKLGAVR
jgi:hypothetical protein